MRREDICCKGRHLRHAKTTPLFQQQRARIKSLCRSRWDLSLLCGLFNRNANAADVVRLCRKTAMANLVRTFFYLGVGSGFVPRGSNCTSETPVLTIRCSQLLRVCGNTREFVAQPFENSKTLSSGCKLGRSVHYWTYVLLERHPFFFFFSRASQKKMWCRNMFLIANEHPVL